MTMSSNRNTIHPCDTAWPLGSQRPKTATQIYAQKCTTKPIAFKPAIEFSTVLIQLLWKKCAIQDAPVPKEKS